MQTELLRYLVPLVVIAIVGWRMMGRMQARPLKPSRLWIRPAMLAAFLALAFLHPPALSPQTVGIFAAAALLGVGLGYLMSRHQHLTVDEATGTLTSRMSPVGMALFLLLFAGRYALRMAVQGGEAPGKLMAHSDQVMMWTDAGLIFVLALVSAQAWEISRRANRLLADHAASKSVSPAQ